MSKELDEQMKPFGDSSQTLQDRVAETLNLFHDFPPIEPTKKAISISISNESKNDSEKIKYDNTKERDISMLANIPRNMVVLGAYAKSLEVAEPCEARSAFMEQLLRLSRSEKGFGLNKAIDAMKAVRPFSEDEKIKSRFGRLWDTMRGR